MNFKYWIFMITVFLVTSCSSKLSKDMIGTWTIDSIKKNDNEIMFHYLSNVASFAKGGTCSIPITNKNNNRNGKWHIEENNSVIFLTIDIEENDLSGTYQVSFWRDYENKLFKVTLKSNELEITCSKLLHNFNKSKNAL